MGCNSSNVRAGGASGCGNYSRQSESTDRDNLAKLTNSPQFKKLVETSSKDFMVENGNASGSDCKAGDRQESGRSERSGRGGKCDKSRNRSEEREAFTNLRADVLKDGKITPEEAAQLQAALAATRGGRGRGGNAGGGSTAGAGTPTGTAPNGGATGGTAIATPASTSGNSLVVKGPDNVTGIEVGNGMLGNTKLSIQGGTAEQREKTQQLFEQMYAKDLGFKQAVDNKAKTGIGVTFEDHEPGIGGTTTIGGHDMTLDPEYIGNTQQFSWIIAHEIGHGTGLPEGRELENFSNTASSKVA